MMVMLHLPSSTNCVAEGMGALAGTGRGQTNFCGDLALFWDVLQSMCVVGERGMLQKLKSVIINHHHPLHYTMGVLRTSFSQRLTHLTGDLSSRQILDSTMLHSVDTGHLFYNVLCIVQSAVFYGAGNKSVSPFI